MRVPAVLFFGVSIVLSVLTTREVGGGRLAQVLTAWSMAFAAMTLLSGHLLSTASLDLVLWAAVLLAVTRAILRAEPRWWLVAGALVGVATYNKLLIGMLLVSLAAGLLMVGPRSLLRSRHVWLGAAIALVLALPNLLYQLTHDLPQLTMAAALSENNADDVRVQVLPMQLLLIGPLLAPVWIAGLVALLRRPAFRPVRAVAVAYLVAVALTFIGLPFVVRTLQPVLEDLHKETEEAAATLGASRWQTFTRVIFPTLMPALLTGFALAFARALGEYGSVIFIAGNMPLVSEITPLLIITKLEQYDYAGATALAVVMLVISFALLLIINLLQWWSRRRSA